MRSARRKLLVIDTDPAIHRYLHRRLSCEGYDIAWAQQPESGPARVAEWNPDILVMATDLLATQGASFIGEIKMITSVPILGLLPNSDAADAVQALNAGFDDCIATPFSLKELAARLRKMLRRDMLRRGLKPSFMSDELEIDLVARRVQRDGQNFVLSDIQVRLLQVLMAADGGVVALTDLLHAVCSGHGGSVSTLRSAIYSLRTKIEVNANRPTHILTEPRIGYRLAFPVSTTVPGGGASVQAQFELHAALEASSGETSADRISFGSE